MADNEVGIDIRARLDRFRQDMATIPDIGGKEAKALAAQLQKDIRAAERAARAAAKASRDAGKEGAASASAFKRAGEAAEVAGSGFGKAAQAAGLLPGPLGEVLQSLADVADSGELAANMSEALGLSFGGAAAITGTLAGGLAAVAAGYYAVEGGIARAAAEQETYREISASLLPTLRALEDAQLDLLVATDEMTEARAREQAEALASQRAVQDFGAAQAEQRAELRKTIDESQKLIDVMTTFVPLAVNPFAQATDAVFGWSDSIEKSTSQLAALDAAVVTEAANQKTLRQTLQDTNQATEQGRQADDAARAAKDAVADATRRAEEAARAQAEAFRETIRLMAEDSALTAQVAAGIDGLRTAADAAADARLSGEAKVRDALNERLDQLEAEYQAVIELATADQERLDAAAAYTEARVEAERTAAAEIGQIRDAASKREFARVESEAAAKRQTDEAYLSSIASLYGAISDVASATGEAMTQEQKDQRLALFYVAQAGAAADAAINTWLAISAANTLPPPANVAAVIAAAAAGLAAEIGILSAPPPTFHSGFAPDEFSATLKTGEGVASTQGIAAMGGPEVLRAYNAGRQPEGAGAGRIVVVKHKHKVFNAQVEENVRAGGAVAKAVARAAGRRGHRR